MSYFPMFIQLEGESCLVVGGGRIAFHKVKVLKDFGAEVVVVAPEISEDIKNIGGVTCQERCFETRDLKGRRLAVAATDDREENHRISFLCRKEGIPVNAVDQTEDCDFIFPSYIKRGEVTAAFSSGGQSPAVTQYLKEQMQPILTEHLGELTAQLGSLRSWVKQIEPAGARKAVYQALLSQGLEQGTLLSEEDIGKIILKRFKEEIRNEGAGTWRGCRRNQDCGEVNAGRPQ